MEQIGRYRIVGELGRGAMGIVYHAIDPALGRPVAIKTIPISDIGDLEERQKLRDRLFVEARSAGVLSHPNIVTIYDMDEVDDLAFIAMAYVNGPTLEKILSSQEPLSGANMLRILRQAALALDYAHSKEIVHRDIKPANIMTDEDGSVKITDFGIATIMTAGLHQESTTIAGTPNYMSPEQIQGFPLSGRSDQFSLAVIAYEILTGERPFPGEQLADIAQKIVGEEPAPAHRVNGTLTESIDQVLRKALSKNPEDRFPNCSNFVGALDLACAESRGWKTLSAGSAALMPTVVVEREAEPVPAPAELGLEPEAARQRKHTSMLPMVISAVAIGGVLAVVGYRTGLVGGGENPVELQPQGRQEQQAAAKPEQEATPSKAQKARASPKPAPFPDQASATRPQAKPEGINAPPPIPEQSRPPAASRVQDIWVTSNPPGARATLDGDPDSSCQTPCMLHGAPGVHRLNVSQNGYQNEHREVVVGNTAVDVPVISLREQLSTLMLITQPRGASIRVNGELMQQTTPAQLSLPPGTYTITVERNGQSKTERVQLGETTVLLSLPLQ